MSTAEIGFIGRQSRNQTLHIQRGSLVNNVEIVGVPCRTVRYGCRAAHNDKCYFVAGERSQERLEVGHGRRARHSRPARRNSSANRATAMALRKRSSTVSLRFSRINVRSMSFL